MVAASLAAASQKDNFNSTPHYVKLIRGSVTETVEISKLFLNQSYSTCNPRFHWQMFKQMDGLYYQDFSEGTAQLILPNISRFQVRNDSPNDDRNCHESGYLFTDAGTYRFSGSTLTLIGRNLKYANGDIQTVSLPQSENHPAAIFASGGRWFEDKGGTIQEIPREATTQSIAWKIRSAVILDDNVWILSNEGAFLYDGKAVRRVPDLPLDIEDVQFVGGSYWIILENQGILEPDGLSDDIESTKILYEVTPNASIEMTLRSDNYAIGMLALALGTRGTLVSGVYKPHFNYRGVALPTDAKPQFDFIFSDSHQSFEKMVAANRYSAEGSEIELPVGRPHLFVRIRDNYGNASDLEETVTVLPSAESLPIFGAALWLLGIGVIFLLSPYNDVCNSLMSNPWIRKFGSFGTIPLFLTIFPVARNYFLIRYVRELSRDLELAKSKESFVLPTPDFDLGHFDMLLSRDRTMMLLGRSGLGKTSYFRYLTYLYSASFHVYGRPKIPIFIQMARTVGNDPNEMIIGQFHKYGQIEDRDIALWFINQGDFVVFMDGLNEISEVGRKAVAAFADRASKRNFICISSQESYDELGWVPQLRLASLGVGEVTQLLSRTLPPDSVRQFVSLLNSEALDFYRIPQNLQFVIELLKRGNDAPKSLVKLYQAVFAPIVIEWESAGHGEYANIVFERSFAMLSAGDAVFDGQRLAIPDQIKAVLLQHKLLVRSGEAMLFQHDLVKAYFASNYFVDAHLAITESTFDKLDKNWLAMLEFSAPRLSAPERASMFLNVVRRDADLGALLFNRVSASDVNLIGERERAEFIRTLGEQSLKFQENH